MSAVIKLSTKLPGDPEINGLDALHDQLIDDPKQVVCALVWLVPSSIREVIETGDQILTVEARRIEPISTIEKTPADVQALAARLYEERTGQNPLPFSSLVPSEAVVHVSFGEDDDE